METYDNEDLHKLFQLRELTFEACNGARQGQPVKEVQAALAAAGVYLEELIFSLRIKRLGLK